MSTHIYDSITGGHILTSESMIAPDREGTQLEVAIHTNDHHIQYMYYVEKLGKIEHDTMVGVVLQKVYLDDTLIPIS